MSVNVSKELWRLRTSSGIPVKLVKRSGGFSRDSAEGTEEYIIKAEDLLDFVHLGLPTPVIFNGVTYPGRAVMYGVPSLVVDTITWEALTEGRPIDPFGFDPHAPEGTYDENIKAIVKYKPREKGKNDEDSDPNNPFTFLQVNSRASGEFIAPPIPGKAEWFTALYNSATGWQEVSQGDVEEVDIPGTILSPLTSWTVSWPQIPYDYFYNVVLPRLRASIGTVNSSVLNIFGNPPPHTMLLNGWSVNEEYIWDLGNVVTPPISLQMDFLEKNFFAPSTAIGFDIQVTHQHLYRPGVGWQWIKVDDNYLYAQTNHNTIWQP